MTRVRSTGSSGRADDALAQLARMCGVQRRFVDGTGRHRHAPAESVRAVLRAMGLDLAEPGSAARSIERLENEAARRLCEPVVVRWVGSSAPLPLGPAGAGADTLDVALVTEDGDETRWRAEPRPTRRAAVRGLPLPSDLPAGFHRLTVTAGNQSDEATLLVAPPRCFRPHRDGPTDLGVFLPLYAARSDTCPGLGTIAELTRLTDWANAAGARFFGTLPLLTTFLDEPFEPSPYVPVSRSVFGELFVDLHDAAQRRPLPRLDAVLASPSFAEDSARARRKDLVDYRASWALVRRGLEAAAQDVFASDALRDEVERFGRDDALIGDYARFRGAGARGAGAEDERRLFLCAQWLLADQLRRATDVSGSDDRSLYLDLPIGSHPRGFDAHRHPELYATGASLGAPPDDLFAGGQSWGFPPVIPAASRTEGHREFATAVARHLRYAAALRIDHAAGLFRGYWVPDGFPATDGVYVHAPAAELLAVLSILSHRTRSTIVAENLGTIPRAVDRGLRRRGVLGMSIAQFGLGAPDAPLADPHPPTLAALNTHDMPTFAAHWSGSDIDTHVKYGVTPAADADAARTGRRHAHERVLAALRKEGRLDDDETDPRRVLAALLAHLAAAAPEILLVNLEDLWLEPDPQNIPGVVDYPNWRRKASRPLDGIFEDETIRSLLRRLADADA